jgi:hypothetical protein
VATFTQPISTATATQEQADELVMKNSAPIYDAAVADGTIKGWGWLAHHTGGKWRRIQYHASDTIEGLLTAQETLQQRSEAAGVSNDGFAQICGAHDDYIWKSEVGNTCKSCAARPLCRLRGMRHQPRTRPGNRQDPVRADHGQGRSRRQAHLLGLEFARPGWRYRAWRP